MFIELSDRFWIFALNKDNRTPGLMGTAKTLADAREIQDRAIRAAWLSVTIIQQR
jgi:hypothetical protein